MLFRELSGAKPMSRRALQLKYGAATPQTFDSDVALKAEGGLDDALKMSTSPAQMIFKIYY